MFGNLELNDKGWDLKKLSDVAVVPLHYGSTASAVDYDGKIRYIRITDIESSGTLNNDFKSPSEFNEKYLLNKGDILFARSGSVGLTYEFNENYESLFAGYLIRFVPDPTKLVTVQNPHPKNGQILKSGTLHPNMISVFPSKAAVSAVNALTPFLRAVPV